MRKNKKNSNFISKMIGLNNIKNGFNYTKFSINRLIDQSSNMEDEGESFKDACIKHGIVGSSEQINNILEKKYNEIKKMFYYKFIFSILIMIFSFYYLFSGFSVLNFIMTFLISITVFVYSLKEGLYCYQINERELNLSKFWIKRPKLWIPKKFKKYENWEIVINDNEREDNE